MGEWMELDNLMLKSQLDARELMLLDMEMKRHGKEMVIAYAFWFFLGVFGAHRFYIGRTGSAVAQLVLSITIVGLIITGIWAIIDAFLLYNYVNEHNDEVENRLLNEILTGRTIR
jgi:TM2 domain-containing membrane protein YozV